MCRLGWRCVGFKCRRSAVARALEYNYATPRYVWHSVEGGFKPVARGRGRAVELPAATPFIAVRRAPAIWLRKGSEGYLRAPALRIVSGRYKGLHVLLLSPGGCVERSAAAGGALAKYRSSPEGALLELEWGGGGGVAAGASLRVGTGHWRRRYVAVAELRLRKPGATRFAVAWGGAKLVVLPELRLETLRQALGAEVVFAGDPAGAPAELEVAVYKLLGKDSRVVPLG